MKKKKPDQVVWDQEQEDYIARLLPYATQANGPVIKIPNVDAFKQKGVEKVSKQLQIELEELQNKIKNFSFSRPRINYRRNLVKNFRQKSNLRFS